MAADERHDPRLLALRERRQDLVDREAAEADDRPAELLARRLGHLLRQAGAARPKNAGSATYNAVSQEYRLSAAGVNMWGPKDEFHFAWKRIKGDFILQARLQFVGEGVDPHRKAGVIVRASLDADAPYADAAVHGDGLVSLQFRRDERGPDGGGPLRGQGCGRRPARAEGKHPHPLRRPVRRDVHDHAGRGASPRRRRVRGALRVLAQPEVVETAIFRDVRLDPPGPQGFVPYRDYIGSRLEILDVRDGEPAGGPQLRGALRGAELDAGTGARSSTTPRAAPRAGGGSTASTSPRGTSAPIDTGPRCATTTTTSSPSTGRGWASATTPKATASRSSTPLPATGGEPKRITPKTPSYFHGWSPDGKTLVYTGGRNDEFDIYKIASDGQGEETNLTRHPGLDDGPEYTPDGQSSTSTRSAAARCRSGG